MRRIAVGVGLVLVVLLVAWKACGTSKHGAVGGGSAAHGPVAIGHHARDKGPVQPASVSGRVTSSDGKPIAGATVSLAPAELLAMFVKSDMPTLTATSDANGSWKAPRVMPGAYVVAATATAFLPGEHGKIIVQQGEQRTGVDLVLTAGGMVVRGSVTDVGGGAIADARITAVKNGDGVPDLSGHADLVTATNADGKYELTLADGDYRLEATHDEYTSASHSIELRGQPVVQDFQLIPGAVIRGQVIARDSGKPVGGAFVRAEGGHGGPGGGDDGATAIADGEGNFTLRSLDSGSLEIMALGRGYSSAKPTFVAVGIGEQVDGIRVMVDRAYSITGHVVRKGKPDQGIPGITLGAFSIASKSFGFAIEPSAQDGYFEIYGLKPASYMLFAVGEGSVPEVGQNVEIVDKDVDNVKVELSTGVTVAGHVEPPMAGAKISVDLAGEVGLANMFDAAKLILVHGETDASGAFVLKTVPAGSFKLKAIAPAGNSGEQPLTVADADVSGVTIKLEPRASVSGRVVDSNGAPVAGGRVSVDDLEDHKMSISFNDMRRDSTTTNADGTYKIVGLDAGKVRVRAHFPGDNEVYFMGKQKAEASKSAAELTLVAGKETPNVNLTVEARDGVIKGTVVGPDGKGAADAWVTAQRVREKDPNVKVYGDGGDGGGDGPPMYFGGNSPPVLTGSDGSFTIAKLRKKDTYNLVVEGPKGLSHGEKPGVKPGDSVTIPLAALGTLTGKVTAGGAPVTSYDIECRGPRMDSKDDHVEAKDGAYSLERLTPGKYTCNVDAPGGSATGTIDIPAGDAKLDLSLIRYATVTGVVVSVLTKQPLAGLHVFAGNDSMSSQNISAVITGQAPVTDAAGHFVLGKVAAGKGKVAVMPKDGFMPLGTRDYTATEGATIDVGTIEVIPPRTGDAGTFGFSTSIEGDKLLVASVKDDGPAAAAGVQVGDRILAIDGRDVVALTPPIASQLLASGSIDVGQTVQLSLERGGGKVTAAVTSVKW